MDTYIALIRGINVGGRNLLAMADLRALVEALRCTNAKTLLQSGNLVFCRDAKSASELELMIETQITKRHKLSVDCIIRSPDEWKSVVARNPFAKEAARDPGHLVAMFFKKPPGAKDVEALRSAIKGPETIRAIGRELYCVYPDGIGVSKLTNTLIEKTLGLRGTARNWNTVLKLAALVAGLK